MHSNCKVLSYFSTSIKYYQTMFDYMDGDDIEGLEVPPERNFFAGTPIIAAVIECPYGRTSRTNIQD